MLAERRLERTLGRIHGAAPGPTLLCVGGLHGNEPAGVEALRRVFRRLESSPLELRGRFIGLAGNCKALAEGRRYLSRDLNRIWLTEEIERLHREPTPEDPEDEELRDLHLAIREVIDEAVGPVFLLDLHTTSGPGPPFAVLDDTLESRDFALELPVPVVLGIEEELDGTLASHLMTQGVVAVGFECGQHDDPASVDCGEAAVWIALAASGVLPGGSLAEVESARRLLSEVNSSLPRVVETRYRHEIRSGAGFRIAPGFVNFEPVERGQVLSWDDHGPITATESGRILMPLYQEQGNDGFFIVRDVRPVWLTLSAALRRARLERLLHWLPGVRRKSGDSDTFVVDRRVARWYALEILHLFGFRRHGHLARHIEFSRRVMPRRTRRQEP